MPSVSGKVRGLSGGQRQAVAIARGVMWGRELVIMDEPTAALGVQETAKVETLIRDLVTRGIGIVVISHNLEQVMRLSTRIWVMRGGRVVDGIATDQASKEDVVAMITGLHQTAPQRSHPVVPDQPPNRPKGQVHQRAVNSRLRVCCRRGRRLGRVFPHVELHPLLHQVAKGSLQWKLAAVPDRSPRPPWHFPLLPPARALARSSERPYQPHSDTGLDAR